jgi:transcriptional regulator with XRE-family HTH domain
MNHAAMGARIKARRKELHLTQGQLAEVCSLSSSFLGHIERGTRIASIDTLCALCSALNVSADYLLGLQTETAIKPILDGLTQEDIEAGSKLLKKIIALTS